MTTRRTEREVTYNEPYRRTEPTPPEAARHSRAEQPQPEATEAGRTASPAPEVATGRMSLSDRISGGPIWSGFIIGFAVWIFLQLALIAAGLSGIRAGGGVAVQPSEWWWSLAAGLIALFVGGLIAGMGSRWHTAGTGAMQGLTVWALSFVVLLVLGALGAGLGFGAFSDAVSIGGGGDAVSPSAIQAAEDAAGWAVLLLLATAAAAVVGGIVGSMLSGRAAKRHASESAGRG